MPKRLPFSDVTRLLQVYREVLGRDLTLAEQKYLGLSGTAIPLADLHPTERKTENRARRGPRDLEQRDEAQEKRHVKNAKAS